MPAILPDDGVDAALRVHEQFVELLCADDDLLRAEFEAIVAAEWPSPPKAPPARRGVARGRPRASARRGRARAVLPSRPRHPGSDGWARERSPPTDPR